MSRQPYRSCQCTRECMFVLQGDAPCLQCRLQPGTARLSALVKLDLYAQNSSGTLPAQWASPGAFPNLQFLRLSLNHLTGSLPASWGTPGAFPALRSLYLNNNELSGTLPAAWGQAGAFPNLQLLFVGSNNLTGRWVSRVPCCRGQGATLSKYVKNSIANNLSSTGV